MNSPVSASTEHLLLTVIVQIVIIVAAARLSGRVFQRMAQPQVCGEIAAGLLLGPSVFGRFFPAAFQEVFDPAASQAFSVLSQIGLILLMFLIGLEFDFDHVGQNRRAAFSISACGVLFPMTLGSALGFYLHRQLGLEGNALHFALFMAVAMSITAIPILGRIMIELNMNRTRLGSLVISAAAVDDACGWILLAAVTAVSRSSFSPLKLTTMIFWVLLYVAAMFWAVRPLLKRWIAARFRRLNGEFGLDALAAVLILLFLSAALTNLIGIFSIFGAFIFGAILYDEHEFAATIREKLNDFVTVFFLPIFFTYTGLRTDIGSMSGSALWLACGLVLMAAVAGKLGGTGLAARLNGLSFRDSAMVGVMMNTRALMELIVINVGYDLGIIPRSVFFMLVFMAVFTTYMTVPLLRLLMRPAGARIKAVTSTP